MLTRSWKQIQKTFYNNLGSNLFLELQHSIPFTGSLAIDDIKLTMGKCKLDQGVVCDFQNDDYCGYEVGFPQSSSI